MDEMADIWKKLREVLKRDVPDAILEDADILDVARWYLNAKTDRERSDAWGALEDAGERALRFWDAGREEGLRGVQSGSRGGSRDMREAEDRDSGERSGLDPRDLYSDRTKAMTGAMSALFAIIGDRIPEVQTFREKVLPGWFLAANEAHAFIASYAARSFSLSWFEEWGIPFVGHRAEVTDISTRGGAFDPVDHSMTIHVDLPGVTKTVRYAVAEDGDSNTRCLTRSGAIVPIHTYLLSESHGDYTYPSWLWPGSVVDELYDLSVDLAGAFDWPLVSAGNLGGTRPRSESAALFVLTGEAPQVRPLRATWEPKQGSMHLNPQWRIQLSIPPWLPEEEVLEAFRFLRRQKPKGRQMPKTARPLEVARFVWERERLDGYRHPAPWTKWVKQWNNEHPGHGFKSTSDFYTYFFRGDAAVRHLNFYPPKVELQEDILTPP
jgi:hypothetical protein